MACKAIFLCGYCVIVFLNILQQVPGQFDANGEPIYVRPLQVREENEDFKLMLEAKMLHNRHSNHTPGKNFNLFILYVTIYLLNMIKNYIIHSIITSAFTGVVWIPDKFYGALGPDIPGQPTMDEEYGCKSPDDFSMDKYLSGGYRGIYGGGSHVFATKKNILKKPANRKFQEYLFELAFTYVGSTDIVEDCHFVSTSLP